MIDEWIDFGESKLMNSQDMMNNVTLLKILDLIHINEDLLPALSPSSVCISRFIILFWIPQT